MQNPPLTDGNEKARKDLVLFGIPEREARIYLALLIRGQSKAGEVAAHLGLHRLDVYHDLKSMQSKNMVEATISKPMKFQAVPLEAVVDNLQRSERESMATRSSALADLRNLGEKLKRDERDDNVVSVSPTDKIQIIGGQKSISERWTGLLASAQKEILVAAIDRGSAKLLLLREIEEISKKMKAGVSVRIFTPVSQSSSNQFKEVASEVRHLESISSAGVCIVDSKEVMIIPEQTEGERNNSHSDETAILITSPSIVEMFRVLFFVGWDTSPAIGDEESRETGKQSMI